MTKGSSEKKQNGSKKKRDYDGDSLNLYIKDVSRIPLLTREEEIEIARLSSQGNKEAREKLVKSNLRFVIKVAKKFKGHGLPIQDLISEGNIGLMTAAEHFDVDKGYRFVTYAVWWIRQAISKAIFDKVRMIRLPNNKSNLLARIEKSRQELTNEPGWNTDEDTHAAAVFLNMSPEKFDMLMRLSEDTLSLDEPVSRNETRETTLQDYVAAGGESPEEYAMNHVLREELIKGINSLEKRTADIVRCRFGLGDSGFAMTLNEVGDQYDITRERVRQIEKRGLTQLQKSFRLGSLEGFIAG